MGCIMLGKQNYIQQTHLCLSRVALRLRWLLKRSKDKSPYIKKIPADLFKWGVEQFALKSINLLVLFVIRRNCLRNGRSRSLYLFVSSVIKHFSIYRGMLVLSTVYKIWSNILLSGYLRMKRNYLVSSIWISNATGQLLIIYSTFVKYLRKNGTTKSSASAVYGLQESLWFS